MGIRPNGDGAIPPVTPDNPETRYSDWLTDLEDSGEIVGGVWKETDAKATSANQSASDLAGRVENLETAPVKPHTHVSADITDTTGFADSTMGEARRILRTGQDGWLYSRDNPVHANHVARKGYIDQKFDEVQNLPVKDHTHTSEDITDSVVYADSTSGLPDRLVRTAYDGFLYSRDNPTRESQLARKGYVDDTVAAANDVLRELLKNAIIAVPPADLADLPTGQVYMDIATLTIHTK